MSESQWISYLVSNGVDPNVAAEEASDLVRYGSVAEVERLNGSGWMDRLLTRSNRATASAGGVGGDADLDEDGSIDDGWFLFESDPGEYRLSQSSNPASVGLTATVPSQWGYWPSDMDRADYITALEDRWASLPGAPTGNLTVNERRRWIETFIETQVTRQVVNAAGMPASAIAPALIYEIEEDDFAFPSVVVAPSSPGQPTTRTTTTTAAPAGSTPPIQAGFLALPFNVQAGNTPALVTGTPPIAAPGAATTLPTFTSPTVSLGGVSVSPLMILIVAGLAFFLLKR